jgi:hypothetical protein
MPITAKMEAVVSSPQNDMYPDTTPRTAKPPHESVESIIASRERKE